MIPPQQFVLGLALVGALLITTTIATAADSSTSPKTGPSSASNTLSGITWRLVELSGIPVATALHGEQPFILFDQAKRQATGYAGCNRFFGGYNLDGDALKFGPLGATKRACPDLETGLETEFFKVLDAIRRWEIVGGSLRLLSGDAVLARLEKVQGS